MLVIFLTNSQLALGLFVKSNNMYNTTNNHQQSPPPPHYSRLDHKRHTDILKYVLQTPLNTFKSYNITGVNMRARWLCCNDNDNDNDCPKYLPGENAEDDQSQVVTLGSQQSRVDIWGRETIWHYLLGQRRHCVVGGNVTTVWWTHISY